MWVRDRLSELFWDEDFADWYPSDGRRGIRPLGWPLVSVLQFTENLTDPEAAEAVRCRIDWHALGLELDDPGFDHSVLSEFRDRIAEGDRADRLLTVFVERLVAAGPVRGGGRQRTDSTHVLAAAWRLNRAEPVGESLRAALEAVVTADRRHAVHRPQGPVAGALHRQPRPADPSSATTSAGFPEARTAAYAGYSGLRGSTSTVQPSAA
ncbi:transposase [Embleya sp. AB8]|uniref:transposase n=1 Tax=Embleya sp. AB8 TaxID=3156304 RepID=UPI003C71B4D2